MAVPDKRLLQYLNTFIPAASNEHIVVKWVELQGKHFSTMTKICMFWSMTDKTNMTIVSGSFNRYNIFFKYKDCYLQIFI